MSMSTSESVSIAAMTRPTPRPQTTDGDTHAPRLERCVRTIGASDASTPPRRPSERTRWCRHATVLAWQTVGSQAGSGPLNPSARLISLAFGLERRRIEQVASGPLHVALELMGSAARLSLGTPAGLLHRALSFEGLVTSQLAQSLLDPAQKLVLLASHD